MRPRNGFLSLLMLFALLYGCAPSPPQKDALVLLNGLLIDGTGSDPLPNAVVVIQGERIVAVGSSNSVKIPRGARLMDLKGAAVLPGFVNAHVHYAFDKQNLKAWAQGGVTTVRDEGIISSGDLKTFMSQRDANNQDPQYARVVSAGRMITVPTGYGWLFVTSEEDARLKVFDELDAGVDMIKISIEDGYAGRSGLPKLTNAEIAAIISAAHERGVRVSGHITQAQYMQSLVEAGVDDIAHIPYDTVPDNVWSTMVSKNIYMTPTFTVLRNYGASIDTCVENLRSFLKHGGQVALGNDYGGGPNQFELGIPMYEIEKMSEAGMSPMQVIVASTKNAAIVLGIGDQVGTLEVGKIADVLIVSSNPLDDLQNLLTIQIVVHNGQVIRDES